MSEREPNEVGMTGYRTTYHQMFNSKDDATPKVARVAIPLIQRDYAQGREDHRTEAIRNTFLDALHFALTTQTAVGLDFVYGEVRDGTFEPLDGQQRLTTLFLLHWYLAMRRSDLSDQHAWTEFTYATRPSARLFCERIVKNPPPSHLKAVPSEWIQDQSWFLHLWRFDPSIRAMLVTLDAIADRFANEDADLMWARLTHDQHPGIWFQLLPIGEMGAAEDLYIKMNSRGKPLTEFEAFKAYLGQLVDEVGGYDAFGHRIDGPWTDVFWPYRGDNQIVDDEFMRYFDFLIEVCEWRDGVLRGSQVITSEKRVEALLGAANPRRQEHLAFIYTAFDTWVEETSVSGYFAALFKTSLDGDGIRLFGAHAATDLFHACCERYGDVRGSTRLFSLTDTLLLLAVLEHRLHSTEDVEARLRVVRNVNEASQFEMRVSNMPKFVNEVAAFMRTGDLLELGTFNTNQVNEEAVKRALLIESPLLTHALHRLEDHDILRGTLAAFELDVSLADRASAFEQTLEPALWPVTTGALLACGEYQRSYPNSDQHRFGSPTTDSVWRLMLVDRGDRNTLAPAREALSALLARVAASDDDIETALQTIIREFTGQRRDQHRYDWRYHMVRYAQMREGNTGIYYGANQELGYEMTMLRKSVQSSYYRDAYLYAMWVEAGKPNEVVDPWFYGYSTTPRWMELSRSGVGLRCTASGIAIRPGTSPADTQRLEVVCHEAGAIATESGWLLSIPQTDLYGPLVDSIDRVRAGAKLLRSLISAGL